MPITLALFKKLTIHPAYDLANPTLRRLHKTVLNTSVQSSVFHNHLKLQATQISINRRMDTHTVVHAHHSFSKGEKPNHPPQKGQRRTTASFPLKKSLEKKRNLIRSLSQPCPTLCSPTDCSLPGSTVCGMFQTRILEWVATSFSNA